MLQRLREARRDQSGFTLIELLIVIVILGVLATLVVFGVAQFADDSRVAACKADQKNLSVAAEAYKAKNPGTAAVDAATLVSGGYLKSAPVTQDGLTPPNIDGTSGCQ